jgi:DNA polymerase-1
MFTKSPIKSIKPLGIKQVCDITVENDHSYVANGFINHNSSREPNLQNIPRDTTSSDIKKMFIPRKGYLILQLDYSQAELRVLASLAKEETMLKWFRDGRDIHLATACKKKDWDYDEMLVYLNDENHPRHKEVKMERKKAKTTNFGIAYEQGGKALSEKMTEQGVPTTKEQAEQILVDWFRDFPKVKKYIDRQHKFVKKNAFVRSVWGRKRRLPNVDSSNYGKQLDALRQSTNAPIQGAASDFALFSSVLIREEKLKGNLPEDMPQLFTVHDSLGFEVRPKDIHKVVPILHTICLNPDTMKWFGFELEGVKMEADFEVGVNWGTLRKYNKDTDYTKLLNDTI